MATWPAVALGIAFGGIFATGLVDDLRGVSARKRLAIQAGVAALLWWAGFRIDDIAFGSWTLELSAVSLPLTLFWFMGFMNTSNLMDGMDGLSGGMNLIALLALGVFGIFIGSSAAPWRSAAAALAVVFLVCNLRGRGKVFMGDSGSLTLGLLVGTAGLLLFNAPGNGAILPHWLPLVLAVGAFFVGIMDMVASIVRRRRRGHSLLLADNHHFHHRLLRSGMPHLQTLLCIQGLNLLAVALLTMPLYNKPWVPLALGLAVLAALVLSLRFYALARSLRRQAKVIPLMESPRLRIAEAPEAKIAQMPIKRREAADKPVAAGH